MAQKKSTMVIIKETQTLSLGTLAAGAAISVGGPAITDDFRIIKSEVVASIEGLATGQGNNLVLGIANADLTAAELAESLVTDGPVNASDRDKAEEAGRFTRMLSGAAHPTDGNSIVPFLGDQGGPIVEKTIRWTFSKGVGWDWFIFNNDGSALTTGATLRLLATHYGVWVN